MKKYLLLISLLALAGCEEIFPKDFAKAEELCKANGGVKKLFVGPLKFDVLCNNNAEFSNINKHYHLGVE